ncbi:hypothetical protein [Polyangium jinanense]|uniref:Uncharacterized protein n=1 Tax=Polyangium jinanense TaxID=2829994 RepID=A0A9X3X3U7_9BACT|nr:hypothetical protein [Polyangium jinanense]MDC3958575.1 hypothetical protein [Polyangium jinanense]MDC3983117.1 hypothetical protein [Polyangium jinanense]
MTAPSEKPPRLFARIAAAALLLGLLGFLVTAQSGSKTPASPPGSAEADAPAPAEPFGPQPAPPDPSLVALLDGLTVGAEVNGWKVVNFYPTNESVVWVELQKGEVFFSVGIGPKGTGKPPPPIQTETYEVGYGMPRPRNAGIPTQEMTAAAELVAARIRKREKEVPRPEGVWGRGSAGPSEAPKR